MVKKPPVFKPSEFLKSIGDHMNSPSGPEYFRHMSPVDGKGRYQHYDEMRFRVKAPASSEIAWSFKKMARSSLYMDMIPVGEPMQLCKMLLTPTIQKATSAVDKHATTATLKWMMNKVGERAHIEYLLNDLIEDEAISSSQLEGAATTTIVAKDMLRQQRKPRTADEKMILGNYKMMSYAWEHRNEPLSIELIQSIHHAGVLGIDDEKYTLGLFRTDDDIIVEDADNNIVHQPPPAARIKERLQRICDWINQCHDDAERTTYIHPLVKAISLHFSMGYEHVFKDGNGRVARALFYWFMFKNDYGAFRYIAISTMLKKAAIQYGKSYVHTETDEMDLTYFVDYQCQIILRALKRFTETYQTNVTAIQDFNMWVAKSGLFGVMTEKQRAIMYSAIGNKGMQLTTNMVKAKLHCSYNTAASALKGMVEMGILEAKQEGRQQVFTMRPLEDIQKHWNRVFM